MPAPVPVLVPPRSLLENGSLVAFPIRNEHHGGDVHENGCFPIRKCVLHGPIRDRGPFLLLKWIIDHFSNKEWGKMLQNPRSGTIPSFKIDH